MCSKLWTALDRLARFRVAVFLSTDVLSIRLYLPQLTARQLDRMDTNMAAACTACMSQDRAVTQ